MNIEVLLLNSSTYKTQQKNAEKLGDCLATSWR